MAASSRLGVLMKLDKNQRKPRVFKASDLCPYYNRRVNAADNTCSFHISISFNLQITMLLFVNTRDLYAAKLDLSLWLEYNRIRKTWIAPKRRLRYADQKI